MKNYLALFIFTCVFFLIGSMHKVLSVSIDNFVYSSEVQTQSSSSSFLLNSFLDSIPTPTPTPEIDFCVDVPVFLYHHTQPMQMAALLGHPQLTVDSNIFDEQIRYLKEKNYNIISAEDLVYALKNRKQLPAKTLLITVDDGYDDNYTYAFSTAKKYEVIINFMIPTDLIDKPGYMTWGHLQEMVKSPYAKIYNHTASHAALGGLSQEQIEWQLGRSSEALKNNLDLDNTIFTYPYGSYSDLAIEMIKKHGFTGAFTTIEGKHQCKSQIMLLQRQRVGNSPLSFYGF